MGTATIVDPSKYVENQTDELDQELEELESKPEIPERFKGKSPEEIAQAYIELEKKASRLGNEVHDLRTKVLQPQTKKEEAPKKKDVTVDNLLENPEEAIETVLTQSSAVRKLSEDLERLDRAEAQKDFERAYPKYHEDLKNDEFLEWISKSQLRMALAQAADQYDFAAAKSLWDLWDERKQILTAATKDSNEAKEAKRKQALKAGTLESGTGNTSESKKVFSRQEIVNLKTRAMQGDREALEKVNDPKWQAEVRRAYFEKRTR